MKLFEVYNLANNQFLDFGELFVGDTDKVSTLGEAAEVDNIAVLSIDVLVVNNTAAHVDDGAVDHTVDTFERQADLRGGRIGLEGHLDIVGNRIDTDTLTDFGEDKLNGVVFGKVAEGVRIGVGILLSIIFNTESRVTGFLFSIPRLNFDTVDIAMGNTATVGTDTVDGDRRTFGRIQLHATDFFASIDSATILGAVALNIDVNAVDSLSRTDKETDHRIECNEMPSEGAVVVSTRTGIQNEVLIIVGDMVVGILGGSFVVGEVEDGVVTLGAGGGS